MLLLKKGEHWRVGHGKKKKVKQVPDIGREQRDLADSFVRDFLCSGVRIRRLTGLLIRLLPGPLLNVCH